MLSRRSDRQAVRRHAWLAVVRFQTQSSIPCGVHYGFTTLTKHPPAPRLGAGGFSHTATPHFCIHRGKSALRWRANGKFTRPRRASSSFGTGDEGIKNLIPRRHNVRVLWQGLDHLIKPLQAQRRIGIDDIQRAGTDCVCRERSPGHWRRQRGGILNYIRVAVNAVNCDDGI